MFLQKQLQLSVKIQMQLFIICFILFIQLQLLTQPFLSQGHFDNVQREPLLPAKAPKERKELVEV